MTAALAAVADAETFRAGSWIDGYQAVSPAPVDLKSRDRHRRVDGWLVKGAWSDPWWVYDPDRGWAVAQRWRSKAQDSYGYDDNGKYVTTPVPACEVREVSPWPEAEPESAPEPEPQAADTVRVWDVDTDETREVTRTEAAAGMVRYARSLGPGTAACGEVERQAVALLEREPEPQPEPVIPQWCPANNGTGKHRWFLTRGLGTEGDHLPVQDRYHSNARGDLIRYASHETARRAADRLNAAESQPDPEPAVTAWKRRQKDTRFSVCVTCHESTLVSDLNDRCECVECAALEPELSPAPEPGDITEEGDDMNGTEETDPAPAAQPELSEACILDEVADFVGDYVSATQSQRDAMILYAAATHALHVFPTFGRMLFSSEEEASGKTMAMMITAALCANPLDASGTSYALTSALAAAGNTPEQPAPTLYYDEISSLFGRSGLAASRNPIADILRKGYKSGATSQWSVNRVNEKFSIYTPFLLTGLRVAVPRDIRSRSVCILMEPGTPRRYFDAREAEPYAYELSAALARTVRTCVPDIAAFRARGIHPRLKDRRLEIWEPLCAVAYILGGQRWLNRCVSAFKDLALAESDEIALTPRQQTIKDVAAIAASSPRVTVLDGGTEFIGGLVIVDELRRLGVPRYQGRTEAGLALLVSDAMPMNTIQLRVDGERVRGYYVADIEAAWDKIRPDEPEDVEIPEEVNPFEVDDEDETAGQHDVTDVTAVTGRIAGVAR